MCIYMCIYMCILYIYIYVYIHSTYAYSFIYIYRLDILVFYTFSYIVDTKNKWCLSGVPNILFTPPPICPWDAQGHFCPGEVDVVPRRFFAARQLGHGAQGETAIVDPLHGLNPGGSVGLSWGAKCRDLWWWVVSDQPVPVHLYIIASYSYTVYT